jgi:hypothetical protein
MRRLSFWLCTSPILFPSLIPPTFLPSLFLDKHVWVGSGTNICWETASSRSSVCLVNYTLCGRIEGRMHLRLWRNRGSMGRVMVELRRRMMGRRRRFLELADGYGDAIVVWRSR